MVKKIILLLSGVMIGALLTGLLLLGFWKQPSQDSQITNKQVISQVANEKKGTDKPKSTNQSDVKEDKAAEQQETRDDSADKTAKVETKAPNKEELRFLLDVTPQIQQRWNTCAPTTVSMLLSSQGVYCSQDELAADMGTDEAFGTHNANAIAVLNKRLFGYEQPKGQEAGYRLARVTDPIADLPLFKERLKKNMADGYPMYYTFDNAKIYPGRHGEHNVLGIGYELTEDRSDIVYVYYLDPSYMVQDPIYGGLKKVRPEELLSAMLGCVEPEYAW